jgi:hypothetical protein
LWLLPIMLDAQTVVPAKTEARVSIPVLVESNS